MTYQEKINKAIEHHQEKPEDDLYWFPPTDFNGLPSEPQQKKEQEGRIQVAFGLEAQGRANYVNRLVEAGCGWHQVAKAVGWVGFAIFEEYYRMKYADIFKANGFAMGSPNQSFRENSWYYDNKKKKIYKSTISSDEPYNSLRNEILNIYLRVKDKDLFERSDKSMVLDFDTDMDKVSTLLCFHTTMEKDGRMELFSHTELKELMAIIFEKQESGYKRVSPVFYDLIDAPINDKQVIDKRAVIFYKKLQFVD